MFIRLQNAGGSGSGGALGSSATQGFGNSLCSGQFDEAHGCGVHAVAQTGGSGAIVEGVAEMRVAEAAGDGGTDHHQASIDLIDYVFFRDGLPEAGPAGARIEFGVGAEEGEIAADAAKEAMIVKVPTVAGEGPLGVGVARDPVGGLGELALPFFIGLDEAGDDDRPGSLAIG